MQPAIKHAARGFAATPYLHECISEQRRRDAARTSRSAAIYLPDGEPLKAGERVVQAEYAETLPLHRRARRGRAVRRAARRHPRRLHGEHGGFIRRKDLDRLQDRRARSRSAADYRGWKILGPPPPAASGVHIAQMLNILEGYDIGGLGFGTPETIHLSRRGPEDRLRRSRRGQRRSGFRRRAGRAADLEGLCRGAPPRHRSGAGAGAGAPASRSSKARTPRTSPSPTRSATSSRPRRPSTACSAPDS